MQCHALFSCKTNPLPSLTARGYICKWIHLPTLQHPLDQQQGLPRQHLSRCPSPGELELNKHLPDKNIDRLVIWWSGLLQTEKLAWPLRQSRTSAQCWQRPAFLKHSLASTLPLRWGWAAELCLLGLLGNRKFSHWGNESRIIFPWFLTPPPTF